MRPRLVALAALVALLPLLSGCFGGAQRTEWAYDGAGIDAVAATGRTGAGVVIAVLDTGVNTQHPALDHLVDGDESNGELIAFRDFLGNANGPREAFDSDGHGSHVVGILAARNQGSTLDGDISLKGGAPGALLVVGRVCAAVCNAGRLPAAIDWAVAQGADVLSLSLGGTFNITIMDAAQKVALEAAVNRAIDAGVVVVASAGNQGAAAPDVESPADIAGVIAVGSIGKSGLVSDFSSHGASANNVCREPSIPDLPLPPLPLPVPPLPLPLPVQLPTLPNPLPIVLSRCDPDMKPELVAPGEDIVSAWAGSDFYRASGTSQAAPFVTAAVALLLEGHPDLNSRAQVEQLKAALVQSAAPVPGQAEPHDDGAGYGKLDALAALQAYGG